MFRLFFIGIMLLCVSSVYGQSNDMVPKYTETIAMPEFPGGLEAFGKFLRNNVKYPKKARRKYEQGIIDVDVTVDTVGNIIKTEIVSGGDLRYGLVEETLRVIKIMPLWIPAVSTKNSVSKKVVGTARIHFTFKLQ